MNNNKTAVKPLKFSIRFWIDFGPILVFFIVNFVYGKFFATTETGGIFAATASLMLAMPIAMAASWHLQKKISPMLWVSGTLALIFGGLTLYFDDPRFIKIKPTVIFSMFGLILLGGYFLRKPLIKYIFDAAFPPISEKGWLILSRNWGLFFLFKAGLNEFVWRNFSTDAWVTFKTFGFITLTFIFVFLQFPVIRKYGNLKGYEKKPKGLKKN